MTWTKFYNLFKKIDIYSKKVNKVTKSFSNMCHYQDLIAFNLFEQRTQLSKQKTYRDPGTHMTWTNFYKLFKKLTYIQKMLIKLQILFLICVTIRTYLLSIYLSMAHDYVKKTYIDPGRYITWTNFY